LGYAGSRSGGVHTDATCCRALDVAKALLADVVGMLTWVTCCRALNVPKTLLAAMETQKSTTGKEALLIHLSTDQARLGETLFDACQ
jgi:hypothetical protein